MQINSTLKHSLLFILVCAFFACTASRKVNDSVIIQVNTSMPYFFPEKNDTYVNKDSSLFYFKEDMVLFREYYMNYFLDGKGTEKDGTIIFDQSNIKKEIEEHFDYIYKQGDSIGIKYDPDSIEFFNVDSLELQKKYKNAKFYQNRNDKLFSSEKLAVPGIFLNKYTPVIKFDESYCDTSVFIFNKHFPKTDFSLSKEAEKKFRAKIVQLKLIYSSKTADKTIIPRREISFGIKEIKSDSLKKEFTKLIDLFKSNQYCPIKIDLHKFSFLSN